MVFLLKNLRIDVNSFICFFIAVKYEARLEDGTVVSKSDGVEFTVEDGIFCILLAMLFRCMRVAFIEDVTWMWQHFGESKQHSFLGSF